MGVLAIFLERWTFWNTRTFTFIATAHWTFVAVDFFIFVVGLAYIHIASVLPATFWDRWTAADIPARHSTPLAVDVFVREHWSTESLVSTGVPVDRALREGWASTGEVASDRALLAIKVSVRVNGRTVIFVVGIRLWTFWFRGTSALHFTFDRTAFAMAHLVFIDVATEAELVVVLQVWALWRRRTETFGHTADGALSAVDAFVAVDPGTIPLVSTVLDLAFWSGWAGTDGSALDSTLLVVNIFIDIAPVAELSVIGVYGGIGRTLWEGWTATLKFTLGGVPASVDRGVSVLWVTQVSVFPSIGWTFRYRW